MSARHRGRFRTVTRGGCLLAAVLLAVAADTRAQNSSTVTATFTIAAQTKLIFSATTLTFPDADPDTSPVAATQNPITVTAGARFGAGQAVLTVVASDHLRSGMDTMPISALKWTASGPGFVGGTMSMSLAAQTVATWNSSGRYIGSLTFTLDNSWNYAVGNYGTTLIYTLSVP